MSLINPELYEGMKGHGRGGRSLALDEVKSLWALVRDRVRAIGCDLGIWADVPARIILSGSTCRLRKANRHCRIDVRLSHLKMLEIPHPRTGCVLEWEPWVAVAIIPCILSVAFASPMLDDPHKEAK
jgi:hypothetical protein